MHGQQNINICGNKRVCELYWVVETLFSQKYCIHLKVKKQVPCWPCITTHLQHKHHTPRDHLWRYKVLYH